MHSNNFPMAWFNRSGEAPGLQLLYAHLYIHICIYTNEHASSYV